MAIKKFDSKTMQADVIADLRTQLEGKKQAFETLSKAHDSLVEQFREAQAGTGCSCDTTAGTPCSYCQLREAQMIQQAWRDLANFYAGWQDLNVELHCKLREAQEQAHGLYLAFHSTQAERDRAWVLLREVRHFGFRNEPGHLDVIAKIDAVLKGRTDD